MKQPFQFLIYVYYWKVPNKKDEDLIKTYDIDFGFNTGITLKHVKGHMFISTSTLIFIDI